VSRQDSSEVFNDEMYLVVTEIIRSEAKAWPECPLPSKEDLGVESEFHHLVPELPIGFTLRRAGSVSLGLETSCDLAILRRYVHLL
jgi:hypothetical protein